VSQADLSDIALGSLSPKQREVLDLVLDRRTNKEIAAFLDISPSAVEQRLQSVRRRLGVQSRADLARKYEALLDTCAVLTGEKLQVADGVPIQQISEEEIEPFERDSVTSITFSGRETQAASSRPFTQCDRVELFLTKLDDIAGLPGRVAAITVTATSVAFLLAIVMRFSNVL
jgi:DNA-binding CsgD family transcriptional regulator